MNYRINKNISYGLWVVMEMIGNLKVSGKMSGLQTTRGCNVIDNLNIIESKDAF